MEMAAPLADAVVAKVANEAIDSVWRQIGYIWNYKSNIDDLRHQLLKLKAERQSMLHIMDEARKNLEEIEETAILWLKNADDTIQVVEELLKGNDTSEGCFISCSPNLKARHRFSRNAKKGTPVIIQVQQDRSFIHRISRPLDVQALEFVKNYEALDSRMEALKFIVGALKNDDVNLIGVYGLGGVGKTTLVKQQVVSQVKEEGVFKVVATADVTHNLDLSKIQREIAYWLDLKLDIDSIEIRAARLHARLMKEENVLIVLDDIWEKIELEKIGIPNSDDHKGLKILMTSRDLTILMRMNVQRHFLLQVLPEEEAWHLFARKAGDLKSSEFQRIAVEVARRCAGLPVLIVVVATSLRGQELYEWSDALEHLQKFDDKGMDAQVYSALELSYKFLGDDQKSLLVLCAQILVGDIPMVDLVKYAKGLDLFHNCTTIRVLRNRLLKVVNDLKRSCLLHQGGGDSDTVKMHDVIRSFATVIASKQHHVFTVASETELEEWPKNDAFELCTAISLPHCKIPDLPQVLECPKLESFILYNGDPSLEIPDMFFSRMKKLKLLDLSKVTLLPLPSSLCFPQNLQTLCLDYCVLEDISAIGKLNQLQVLSLIGSNIVQLPMEINNLTRLQFLDLRKCRRLEVILPGILICLTKLEELCMLGSFIRWEGEGHTAKTNNASLSELKTLSNLINLEIHITDAKILPVDLFHGKLERFRILIGDSWDSSYDDYVSSKVLKLNHNVGFESERVRILLIETEDLHLDDLKGVENVIPELERQGFPTLKDLHIQNCHEMQVIVDRTRMGNIIFFSSLESLSLLNLNKLENICFGPFVSTSFNNLNKLKVGNCNALKNLFSFTVFRCLSQLHEIDVAHCEILKEIVAGRYEDETIKMTQLHSLALQDLPQLEGFCSLTNEASADLSLVDEFENLFGKEIQFPNLVDLKLSSVNVEKIWRNQSKEFCPFNKLTTFIVQGCRNLTSALTSSIVKSLAQLKELEISDCKSMEEVISAEGGIEEMIFPKLYILKLKGLPKVVQFCRGKLLQCPSMEVLGIEKCHRLQTFVEASQQQDPNTLFDEKVDFPNLDELVISGVRELKVIWGNKLLEDSFYKLKTLTVEDANGLVKVFPQNLEMERFQNLEELFVFGCDALPDVFDIQALADVKKERDGIQVTQLQTLKIYNCPILKHVWNKDPKGILDFQNLSNVYIRMCPSMKNVFPASVAIGLVHLQTFIVLDMEIVEIIAEDEDLILGATVFEFPQLEELKFRRLPQLETFYPGTHISEWPSLKALCITNCNKFHLPILFQEMVFPNLEVLALNGKEVEMIRKGQLRADLFNRLKHLELNFHSEESGVFPYDLLHIFHNLETLEVVGSRFKELFPSEGAFIGDKKHPLIPPRMNSLKLYFLPNLKTIWNQALQTLQTLDIAGCDSLITLAPSSASFQSLTSLDIYDCEGLVSLLAHSTAKSLIQLQKLKVSNCDLLKVIISDEGDEVVDEINFTKLKTLVLDCLSSLTSFCNGNHSFRFPYLTKVVVNQCPKIELFSKGVSSTPLLEMVQKTEAKDRGDWLGNLNSTIIFLYEKMVGFYGVKQLKVSEFSILRDRWHCELPVELFCDLESLVVDEIVFSSYAIPSNLLEHLNSLEKLEVSNCEVLEEIFDVRVLSAEQGQIDLLSKLKEFHLISLPRLRNIWNEHAVGILKFKHLKSLKVHHCSSLKMIFTPLLARELVQLQEMEVKHCNSVEEIIMRGEANEVMNEIIFPLLRSIILESLPGLISLNSGSKILECPSLKKIAIVDCPTAFTRTFLRELQSDPADGITEPKVAFPNLEDLKLSLVRIEKILYNKHQLGMSTFSENLTSLNIDGCSNLKYLFSSSTVKGFIHLQTLEICNCKLMQEIIHMEEETGKMGEIVLPKLELLNFGNLQQIRQFCTGSLIECVALTTLWIENCPELGAFISNSSISDNLNCTCSTLFDEKVDFPNLELLGILGVHELKLIYSNELRGDSFRKLKELRVEDAKQLMKVFPTNFELARFQNLEELQIIGCDVLTEVFDIRALIDVKIERGDVAVSQLKELEVYNTQNLKHVWNQDPKGILNFQNLSDVDISECPSLESVFPASVARGLLHLEKLWVYDSGTTEIIAADEERIEGAPVFEFPQLEELVLRRLPRLETFYPGTHTLEWPALQQVYITQCYQFQYQTLSFKQIISDLEELALTGKEVRMIREGQLPVELFQRLKVVEFNFFNDKYAVFPYDLLHIFHDVETLTVSRSKIKELFPPQGVLAGDEKHPLIPTRMNSLKLFYLPNLKTIRNQVLQTLQTLLIKGCDGLIILAPSSASFQSLTSLDISDCKGLVSLVIFSTAASLTQLENLSLRNCKQVKVIVSDEGDKIMSEINFTKLGTLVLDCLPNLTSFCSENHSFKFPCLKEVVVKQCPKMEFFSKGVSATPMLQRVQLIEDKNGGDWLGNLNMTISFLYRKMVGFRGLQHLKLSESSNWKDRWHNELPVEMFCDLNSLVIDEVEFSLYAIPSNLVEYLNKLDRLEVNSCELLEEVFDVQGLSDEAQGQRGFLSKLNSFHLMNLPRLRQVWNEHPRRIFNFGNLKSLKVHNCCSLRMIFTPSMTRGLVQLQEMELKNCVLVEEIISKEAEEDDVISFPQLNSLVLDSLPELTVFRPGRGIVQCPSLEKITVMDCPNIQVFTSLAVEEQEQIKYDGNSIFYGKVQCQSVKELRVDMSNGIKKILDGELEASHKFFCSLKVLELKQFPTEYSTFPSRFLESSPNLEELVVSDASFEELFSQEDTFNGEESSKNVTYLRRLTLSKLPKLKHLMKDHIKLGSFIQHLEGLEVFECTKLTILVPSSVSFQNLKTLKVSKCHGLLNLITSSTARSLSQLTRLEITECEMLEEIVASEGDEVEEEIGLSQLKHLELHCLPKLTRFCSGNETFNFPVLEEVIVRECPNMEIFVRGELSAPNLESVQTTEDENEWCWHGSLNATVQKLFKERIAEKLEEH